MIEYSRSIRTRIKKAVHMHRFCLTLCAQLYCVNHHRLKTCPHTQTDDPGINGYINVAYVGSSGRLDFDIAQVSIKEPVFADILVEPRLYSQAPGIIQTDAGHGCTCGFFTEESRVVDTATDVRTKIAFW